MSYQEALRRLFDHLYADQIIELKIYKDEKEKEILITGFSENEVNESLNTLLPKGALFISRTILHEATERIQAFKGNNEDEIKKTLNKKLSNKNAIRDIVCLKKCQKGFIGIGRKKGRWQASWVEPYHINFKYITLYNVSVKFLPRIYFKEQ